MMANSAGTAEIFYRLASVGFIKDWPPHGGFKKQNPLLSSGPPASFELAL